MDKTKKVTTKKKPVVSIKDDKPKFVKKKYILKKDLDSTRKKGHTIELTEEGKNYLQNKQYI